MNLTEGRGRAWTRRRRGRTGEATMATAGGAAACGGGAAGCGGARRRAVLRRRRARGAAAACGAAAGVQGRWRRRAIPAAPPLLCLSARDVEGRGGGPRLNRGKCHRSRALAAPGTYDSLFPGREKARDL